MVSCTTDSPVGRLTLCADDDALLSLRFGGGGGDMRNAIIEKTLSELEEYFEGRRKSFDIPLRPEGTEFRLRVWDALCAIPYGETKSYGAIAAAVGSPKAARAVGMANNGNPIAIIIPCHRVIGADGSLTGYAGGLEIKKYLLELENKNK